MHILLRIGHTDPLSIETFLDFLCNVPIHIPVIIAFGPGPTDEVDRGIGQSMYFYRWCRIFQHHGMIGHDVIENRQSLIDVVVIADTEFHVDPPLIDTG